VRATQELAQDVGVGADVVAARVADVGAESRWGLIPHPACEVTRHEWSLFRHCWALFKLVLTILATLVLLDNMQALSYFGRVAAETDSAYLEGLRSELRPHRLAGWWCCW
jgi:hypothetical protein